MAIAFGMKVLGWFGAGDAIARRFAWVPLVIIPVLLAGLIYWIATSWFDSALDTATNAGATAAVVAGQNQTLDQLKDANDAEDTLRADGERSARRYADCLLDSREKQACERYNPDPRQK